MPQTCTICKHPQRAEIEQALVVGQALRDIARQFRVSKDSLHRHRRQCVPEDITQAQAAREQVLALNWPEQLTALNAVALAMLSEARDTIARIEAERGDRIPPEEALPPLIEFAALSQEDQSARLARYRAVVQASAMVGKRLQDEKHNALAALAEVRAQLRDQAVLQGEIAAEGSVQLTIEIAQAAVEQGHARAREFERAHRLVPGKPRLLDAG